MFSQLGPLFKTVLRQAEKSDARLEIRREEKENPEKRQESDKSEEESSFLWEDSTGVSVEALRTFLSEFLKTRGEVNGEAAAFDTGDDVSINPSLPQKEAVSTVAARAVKAYSSMAAQGVPPVIAETDNEEDTAEVDLVSLLAADELRTIHVLIHELDLLARRGVETLTIEKADTFLESLVRAVSAEKART